VEGSYPRCRQIVHRVEGIARIFDGKPLRVSKILQSVSVGPQMIRLAFRVVYGCSPRRFLRDQRLRAVRAELRAATPGVIVTQVTTNPWFCQTRTICRQLQRGVWRAPIRYAATRFDATRIEGRRRREAVIAVDPQHRLYCPLQSAVARRALMSTFPRKAPSRTMSSQKAPNR
jgi:hypothetical protein